MFGKPISALTADDIDRLWQEKIRESDVVEFKRELSGGKSGRHRWYEGDSEVGEIARDAIAKEIMAFANAHGGTLVLGIAETKDKPARAEKVAPVPRCADLAGRLAQMLGDIIEPPLAPFPMIVPVRLEGDSGVVVMQVAASRNAPHRNRQSRQSYARRGEEAVPMTMREIQDLTLQVERGLTLLERKFSESQAKFNDRCRTSTAMGMRATAVPMSPLSVPIPQDREIIPDLKGFTARAGESEVQLILPHASNVVFRPVLRGLRAREKDAGDGRDLIIEVRESGMLEIFFSRRENAERANVFYLGWFLGMACNVLAMADYLRTAAGAPGTEYGLELAVHDGGSLDAMAVGGRDHDARRWLAGSVTFPRYSVSDRANFQNVIQFIERDFWSGAGIRHSGPPLSVDFG